MAERLTFRLSDIDLNKLREIEAAVAPSHTQILRDALKEVWLKQLENFPHPLQIITEEGVVKNKAAIAHEAMEEKLDIARDYEHRLELKQTEIDVLTEKLTELRGASAESPQRDEEEKETSLALALWNSASAKPGLFGFSIDLKALLADSIRILKERARPIELGLNKPPKGK